MLTLYHLNISHFCEKARWALDYKKLEYRSRILTPGFHILTARRVAGTRTVPVLYDDETGTAVPESTDILHYLDRIRPDPPLFPVDADLASAVVEVEDICDQGWGPNSSSAAYCSMVEWPGELRRSWSQGLNAGQKALLALAMPVLVRAFRRVRGLTPEACAEFRAAAVASLDELEAILERNGSSLGRVVKCSAGVAMGCRHRCGGPRGLPARGARAVPQRGCSPSDRPVGAANVGDASLGRCFRLRAPA